MIWRTTVVAALACILVGSWFYAHLHLRHGSVMAFNKSAPTESRLPRARFFTDLARDQLFTSPVRPALDGRVWPSLLSEFWGDHAAYFVVRGWDLRRGRLACGEAFEPPPVGLPRDQLRSNREEIAPYLGRVNVVSLAPTLVLLLGTLVTASSLGLSRGHLAPRGFALALALAFIASTLLFYGWYLWRFVAPEPAAIVKATYLLQVVPFVALLAADALVALRARSAVVFTAVITLWCLALAHNLPVLFSRYLRWPS